jgi:hypothetical protein
MILDAQAMFSEAQAITSTANSTNVYDLAVARDIGAGTVPYLVLQVDTAFTASGSATLDIQFVASAATGLTSPTVIWDSGAIGKATLVAGYRLQIPVPRLPSGVAPLRYLGLIYTVATGPMTAGAITAAIAQGGQDNRYPASGFTVS